MAASHRFDNTLRYRGEDDEQAAVAMIWRVIFDPGSRVRPGRTEPESVWRTRAVLAALREVANGTAR